MRKLSKARRSQMIFLVVIVMAFAVVHISKVAMAVTSEPGTGEDPVITKSYVDSKVKENNKKIDDVDVRMQSLTMAVYGMQSKLSSSDAKIAELTTIIQTLKKQIEDTGSTKFVAIEMKKGQQMVAGDSTEMIIRSGKATAIASTAGGLSDITSGTGLDIKTGAVIPLNHLMLVSRDDGRGLKAVSESVWLLVKGKYTIK